MKISILRAARVLLSGGTIAYPTEGVFGLGCLPDDLSAVQRLLDIKQRDAGKGLILIASRPEQFEGWVSPDAASAIPEPDPAHPITWVVSPGERANPMLRGINKGLAVRVTTNPIAAALCDAVDSPITSTSANLSGKSTVRNRFVLRRQFAQRVDFLVPGDCGPAVGASEIRDIATNRVLRQRKK